jgi:hypothetical protein
MHLKHLYAGLQLNGTVTNQAGQVVTYTYEGEVNARGYEDGHGRSFFSHGDEYIGQWRNGDAYSFNPKDGGFFAFVRPSLLPCRKTRWSGYF